MYYYFQPPYLLLIFGLFAGITSGAAFEATLKLAAKELIVQEQDSQQLGIKTTNLKIPFLGICMGIWLFLAAGLQLFNIGALFAYIVSLAVTLFTGRLVWSQLGKVMLMFQQGGSKALDLDAFE